MLSSDSGRDIDMVKGAGGVLMTGEGRNQIPFCVDENKHHHFAVVYQPRREIHVVCLRVEFLLKTDSRFESRVFVEN